MGVSGKSFDLYAGAVSKDLNTAMLRQYGCKWMVTKASGMEGGFREKLEAAKRRSKASDHWEAEKETGLTFKKNAGRC